SSARHLDWLRAHCGSAALWELGENRGLAAAQNLGIAWARDHAFSHVLLLDHDSIPEAGMVEALVTAWQQLSARGEAVAAVGPLCVDQRTAAPAAFVRWGWLKARPAAASPACAGGYVRTDFLIASGSLIPLSVIDRIGPM